MDNHEVEVARIVNMKSMTYDGIVDNHKFLKNKKKIVKKKDINGF